MSKTDRIERINNELDNEISRLRRRIEVLTDRKNKLTKISLTVLEPHALIPKNYRDVEGWIEGHPFPDCVVSMVYPNKELAFQASLSCNTYQLDYHIVRCKSREYYMDKYLKINN